MVQETVRSGICRICECTRDGVVYYILVLSGYNRQSHLVYVSYPAYRIKCVLLNVSYAKLQGKVWLGNISYARLQETVYSGKCKWLQTT